MIGMRAGLGAVTRSLSSLSYAQASRMPHHRSVRTEAAAKRVLVPVADGTEEMEAVIVIDVLRRAGAEVCVASVESRLQVKCSRGVHLVADASIGSAVGIDWDLIVLPGGMPGAQRLADCTTLVALLEKQKAANMHYAAICAAPAVVLQARGLIDPGQRATVHPAFEDGLVEKSAIQNRVVEDGILTTSRGPGTALEFALALVKSLYGEEKMKAVAGPMVVY